MHPTVSARWFLLVVLGGQFMANMDGAIVNVATPAIGAGFHAAGPPLQLTVSGYLAAMMLLLVPAARLGRAWGYRRVFLGGLGAFTLASLACGIAPTMESLIAARIVQGAGAAFLVAQVLSAIQLNLAAPARSRAIGAFTMTLSGSAVAGQLLGGAVVTANLWGTSWRPIFLINVPLGLALFALALRALPDVRAEPLPGGVPLLDLRLFGVPGVARRIGALACARTTYFTLLFVIALYLQDGLHWSALASGLALVAWVAAYGIAGPIVPRLRGAAARFTGPLGCLLMTAAFCGMLVSASVPEHTAIVLVASLALGGFGFGVSSTALVSSLTTHVPKAFASDLSGVLATLGPAAATAGIATLGTAYLRIAPAGGTTAPYAFELVCASFAALTALAAVLAASGRDDPQSLHGKT